MRDRMTRRTFIGSALATGFAAWARTGVPAPAAPRLRFGVMSDMHITDAASCTAVAKALRYFRERDVGAVVFAGDMIDNGLVGELELFAKTWFDVFPDGCGRDGRKVELLAVLGNHDLQRWTKEWADEIGMPWDRVLREDLDRPGCFAAEWKRLFGSAYEPLWTKSVGGVRFVGSSYQYRADHQRRTAPAGEEEMPQFLERHRAELAKDELFFFIQHMHPQGTCSAPWTWGQDDGTATEILRTFPNAIALSGHSHTPLNDERTLWQGAFTSVGTGAMGFLIPFGGRENSEIDGAPDTGDQLLPRLRPADGKHAMLVSVFDDRIAFERRDFMYDLPLGDDWVVPLPLGDAPCAAERRAAKARAPQFAAGVKPDVSFGRVKSRTGVESDGLTVSFPNVFAADGGTRAFDFEVALEERETDVVQIRKTKRVYSSGYYRGEAADEKTVRCPFLLSDLPAANGSKLDASRGRAYRFVVRPCDSFGNRGRPVFTEWRER